MKPLTTLILLPVCLALAGGAACADYIQIQYRSGKVQTFRLDESSSGIVSISYQDDNAAAVTPPSPPKADSSKTAGETAPTPQRSTGTPTAVGKPPVRIEWAPPVE